MCEVLNKHKTQVETDEKSVVHEVASDEEIDEVSNGEEIDDVASDEEIDEVASDLLGTINESHCGERRCLSLKPRLPSLPTSAIGTPPDRFRNTFNSKLLGPLVPSISLSYFIIHTHNGNFSESQRLEEPLC